MKPIKVLALPFNSRATPKAGGVTFKSPRKQFKVNFSNSDLCLVCSTITYFYALQSKSSLRKIEQCKSHISMQVPKLTQLNTTHTTQCNSQHLHLKQLNDSNDLTWCLWEYPEESLYGPFRGKSGISCVSTSGPFETPFFGVLSQESFLGVPLAGTLEKALQH